MLRIFTPLFTLLLIFSMATVDIHAQNLTLVSSDSLGLLRAAGTIPPAGSQAGDSFDYLLNGGGAGGIQLITGDSILNNEHYANVITSASGLIYPAQVFTSSTSTTTGSTGGLGMLGESIFRGRILQGQPNSMVETEMVYDVTAPAPGASDVLVFHGTFSVSADGTGDILGGGVFAPGVSAVAAGDGVVVSWVNIFETPAVNTTYIANGTDFSGVVAIGVMPNDRLTISTFANTSLGPLRNESGISNAQGLIDAQVEALPLADVTSLIFAGGGGSGGGGTGGGGSGGGRN